MGKNFKKWFLFLKENFILHSNLKTKKVIKTIENFKTVTELSNDEMVKIQGGMIITGKGSSNVEDSRKHIAGPEYHWLNTKGEGWDEYRYYTMHQPA